MAARLQMKLGVVAEQDRLPDSPDTVIVVEPSNGSVARAKGHLYLLVSSRLGGARGAEATRLAAETIRNEYYYDESGIRSSLVKAIGLANKRLAHGRDRLDLGGGEFGPLGVAAAVVRGSELYVTTVGPADAYLVRQARISTLPDPQRDRGLPTAGIRPNVWRGEIQVGDELVLISPNVVERLGVEELKDALVTLHPQSAMEHVHHRFVEAGGSGSDGAVAFEAAERAAGGRHRDWPKGRRAEPVEDDDYAAVPAIAAGGAQAPVAASGFERAVVLFQDLLPVRRQTHRRVTPASRRRETQRRAAVAALAFIGVAFGLGAAVFLVPRDTSRPQVAATIPPGQRALDAARADLARVFGPDVDLVAENPEEAMELLMSANEQLDRAQEAGIAAATITPLRDQIFAGLERLYDVTTVDDTVLFAFDPNANPAIDLAGVVIGPDGAPFALDRTTKAVWRINTETKRASLVLREGTELGETVAGTPRFMATAGSDLLIVDVNNVVWRWRPTAEVGKGTLNRVTVQGSAEWGNDVTTMGTFLTDAESSLYNLYVVDPSEQQIRAFAPDPGGEGFPEPAAWLTEPRPVEDVTSIHIDGDIYLADGGAVERFSAGQPDGWEPESPGDDMLREPSSYRLLTAASGRRAGLIYAWDAANARVVAWDKAEATFVEQFQLAEENTGWTDMRAMTVIETAEEPPLLVWVSADIVHASRLVDVEPDAEPGASGEPQASPDPAASAEVSAAP